MYALGLLLRWIIGLAVVAAVVIYIVLPFGGTLLGTAGGVVAGLNQPRQVPVTGAQPGTTTTAPVTTAAPAVPTQPAPPAGPTAAPAAPTAAPQPPATSDCNRHGQQAWSDSTRTDGHGRSPVGGLQEECWITIETWIGNPTRGFVVILPPRNVAWLARHWGGTGWFIDGGYPAALVNAEKLRKEILERDGLNPRVVDLSKGETFELLEELQKAPRGPVAGNLPTTAGSSQPAPAPSGQTAGNCTGATATGPAIVQFGPPATVVKVSQGITQATNRGGCFPFASQQALDARWNVHVAEFRTQYGAGVSVVEN